MSILITGKFAPSGGAGSFKLYESVDIDWVADVDLGAYNLLTTGYIQFRDSAIHIDSLDDGHLDLTADVSIDLNSHVGITTGKELRFYDADDSNYVGFVAPSLSANKIWILPNADGDANQVLKTDGSGNLSWVTMGGGLSESLAIAYAVAL